MSDDSRLVAWRAHSDAVETRQRLGIEIADVVTAAYTADEHIIWLDPNNDAWLRLEGLLNEFDVATAVCRVTWDTFHGLAGQPVAPVRVRREPPAPGMVKRGAYWRRRQYGDS